MNSVWSSEARGKYKVLASGAEGYGTMLFQKKPEIATEANQAIFAEYREGIKDYSIADSAGSYKLTVDGEKVYVDFYPGDSSRRAKRFTLR